MPRQSFRFRVCAFLAGVALASLQQLGQRRPAFARGAAGLSERRRELLSRGRERLGAGHDQPAAHDRRPPVGRCRCADRDPGRWRHDPHERRHQRFRPQSRRPDHPTAADAGHVACARASPRARPGRSKSTRPISLSRSDGPANTGSTWTPTAMRRRSSCARARVKRMATTRRMSSMHGKPIGSRAPTCVSTSPSVHRAWTISIAGQSDRDRRYDGSVSARYVSPDVVGYQDLDAHGTWRVDATYGNVWAPNRLSAGWAPYRDGHWAWVDPWGWTWIDDAPWGFAVSHYGRWANLSGSWVWIPGPVRSRAYYAPALVVFVGGANFQITISSGNVGGIAWFPLGPREVYRPSYPVSRGYFENINQQQHDRSTPPSSTTPTTTSTSPTSSTPTGRWPAP